MAQPSPVDVRPEQAVLDGNPDPPAVIRHTNPEHARIVLVDWMLGNSCNFACSYCPSNLHNGSMRWQPPELVKAFFAKLHSHYVEQLGRRVWLQFTGGEPTMYPGLMGVLDTAHDRGFQVSVISNGSRTRRFWKEAVERLDAVILTYHDEFADHDAFLETCAVITAKLPLHINVTVHPERFDAIMRQVADIRHKCPRASMTLKPLRVGFGAQLYDYSPAQLEILAKGVARGNPAATTVPRGTMTVVSPDGAERRWKANEFILRDANRWRGYSCRAGLESLRVRGSGEVVRATCGSGGRLGYLGQDIEFPRRPIVCDRDRCGCLFDILITKQRV